MTSPCLTWPPTASWLRDRAIMRFASSQQDGEKASFSICECVYLRVAPSARAANQPASAPPFPPAAERCAFTCVESIICVSVDRPFSSKLPEQVFPDATPRPAHETIIDRCRRSMLRRAIAPPTAAFQNMHDTADDTAIVRPLDLPRTSVGRCGSIRPHCSSLNQNGS